MALEDDEPRRAAPLLARPPLDRLGIEELEGYIAGLRAEIARAEAEIDRKKGLRNAAHAFFKT